MKYVTSEPDGQAAGVPSSLHPTHWLHGENAEDLDGDKTLRWKKSWSLNDRVKGHLTRSTHVGLDVSKKNGKLPLH